MPAIAHPSPPDSSPSSRGAEDRSVQLGILSDDTAYRKTVQFRSFVVHRYQQVDVETLVDMVNHRLIDFQRFRSQVLAYAQC